MGINLKVRYSGHLAILARKKEEMFQLPDKPKTTITQLAKSLSIQHDSEFTSAILSEGMIISPLVLVVVNGELIDRDKYDSLEVRGGDLIAFLEILPGG